MGGNDLIWPDPTGSGMWRWTRRMIKDGLMPDRAIVKRFDVLNTVLSDLDGVRYLVIDAIGDKVRLVRIPEGMTGADFGQRFYHSPADGDPARATLERE